MGNNLNCVKDSVKEKVFSESETRKKWAKIENQNAADFQGFMTSEKASYPEEYNSKLHKNNREGRI